MGGDNNVFGGFVVGSGGGGGSSETYWGNILGSIDLQTDLKEKLDNKMDAQEGKALSSNDYTDADKEKLAKLNNIYTFELLPENWASFGANMFKQTLSLEQIESTDTVIADIDLSGDEDVAVKESEYWGNVERISVGDGIITVYISGSAPDISLNIKIKI